MVPFQIERVKTVRLKADGTNYNAAAGTSVVTSEYVDTTGFEGVEFQVGYGAIVSGAVTSIKLKSATDGAGTSGADVAGTAQTVADTDDFFVSRSEIHRPDPAFPFIAVVTSRATQNATVDFVLAHLYGARKIPITQHATIQGTPEKFASPAQGTA